MQVGRNFPAVKSPSGQKDKAQNGRKNVMVIQAHGGPAIASFQTPRNTVSKLASSPKGQLSTGRLERPSEPENVVINFFPTGFVFKPLPVGRHSPSETEVATEGGEGELKRRATEAKLTSPRSFLADKGEMSTILRTVTSNRPILKGERATSPYSGSNKGNARKHKRSISFENFLAPSLNITNTGETRQTAILRNCQLTTQRVYKFSFEGVSKALYCANLKAAIEDKHRELIKKEVEVLERDSRIRSLQEELGKTRRINDCFAKGLGGFLLKSSDATEKAKELCLGIGHENRRLKTLVTRQRILTFGKDIDQSALREREAEVLACIERLDSQIRGLEELTVTLETNKVEGEHELFKRMLEEARIYDISEKKSRGLVARLRRQSIEFQKLVEANADERISGLLLMNAQLTADLDRSTEEGAQLQVLIEQLKVDLEDTQKRLKELTVEKNQEVQEIILGERAGEETSRIKDYVLGLEAQLSDQKIEQLRVVENCRKVERELSLKVRECEDYRAQVQALEELISQQREQLAACANESLTLTSTHTNELRTIQQHYEFRIERLKLELNEANLSLENLSFLKKGDDRRGVKALVGSINMESLLVASSDGQFKINSGIKIGEDLDEVLGKFVDAFNRKALQMRSDVLNERARILKLLGECEFMSSIIIDTIDFSQIRNWRPDQLRIIDYFRERNSDYKTELGKGNQSTSTTLVSDLYTPRRSAVSELMRGLIFTEDSPIFFESEKRLSPRKKSSVNEEREQFISEKSSFFPEFNTEFALNEDLVQVIAAQALAIESYLNSTM